MDRHLHDYVSSAFWLCLQNLVFYFGIHKTMMVLSDLFLKIMMINDNHGYDDGDHDDIVDRIK